MIKTFEKCNLLFKEQNLNAESNYYAIFYYIFILYLYIYS